MVAGEAAPPKAKVQLLDGIGMREVIEGTDEMIVVGITTLDQKKCGKDCDSITEMFQSMGPTMKGFYDSYLLEVNSDFELPNGTMINTFNFFNVSNTDLPAVFVFPYGAKSLSVAQPQNYSSKELNALSKQDFMEYTAHVKLFEASRPLHLNQSYTMKLVDSYEKRPKSVHTIFLQQLPNRVDILDGANITKWVSEVLPGRKDWSARAILASSQDMIPPLYTKLAIDFCCSGRVRFGFIKGKEEAAQGALEQLNITKFPTLLIGKGHALGSGKNTDIYSGKLKLAALQEWAAGYDDSRATNALVKELSDEGALQTECNKQANTWCFIAVLPDDYNTIEENLEVMKEVASRRFPVQLPSRFVWLNSGRQPNFIAKWKADPAFANPDLPVIVGVQMKHDIPKYHVFAQHEYNPKDIRKRVFDCILGSSKLEFKHLGKMTMLTRHKPTDLSNLEEEQLEREEAELKAQEEALKDDKEL